MLSEKQKRGAQLDILKKLREQGMPNRDNEMNVMFDLGVDEDGRIAQNKKEDEEEPTSEEAKKKKGSSQPALTPLPVGGGLMKPKKKNPLSF